MSVRTGRKPALVFAIVLSTTQALGCLTPPELPVPVREDLIVAGVTVINPGIERLANYTIVVRDGVIREVRPKRSTDPDPICVDCFAVPGLIDAHVHNPPRLVPGSQELFALLYLAHGVTTIRDVGASEDGVAELAARLNEGRLLGPRMFRCGPVLDGDPPGWPVAEVVTDAGAATKIVDRLAAEGVDCIKVYNEVSIEAFSEIAETARSHELPLIGHVPHAVGLVGVFDFEAQHMTGVPYLSQPRPPLGWDIRDEDVLSLTEVEINDAFDLARNRLVSFTPTLANFSLRLIASDPQRFPPPPAARFLPGYWVDVWELIAGHPSTQDEIERRLEAVPMMRRLVRGAYDHGIDVLAGTDTLMPWVIPGDALHREIEELNASLGSAEAALEAATVVNGRHIAPGEIGVIAAGARADILLLPRDPTIDLAMLRDWEILVADGRRYDRATIDEWLEEYRVHFHTWFQRHVIGLGMSWAAKFFTHN